LAVHPPPLKFFRVSHGGQGCLLQGVPKSLYLPPPVRVAFGVARYLYSPPGEAPFGISFRVKGRSFPWSLPLKQSIRSSRSAPPRVFIVFPLVPLTRRFALPVRCLPVKSGGVPCMRPDRFYSTGGRRTSRDFPRTFYRETTPIPHFLFNVQG